jgi:hypothetical protein
MLGTEETFPNYILYITNGMLIVWVLKPGLLETKIISMWIIILMSDEITQHWTLLKENDNTAMLIEFWH